MYSYRGTLLVTASISHRWSTRDSRGTLRGLFVASFDARLAHGNPQHASVMADGQPIIASGIIIPKSFGKMQSLSELMLQWESADNAELQRSLRRGAGYAQYTLGEYPPA
jgi:hypothetical protein